ncbi:MAG: acyl carrier protein [Flavobacteriales bacterium]|jgi:acyl carrier protein|nr:acyl carrier protein [Flavobacteriales bacterium]
MSNRLPNPFDLVAKVLEVDRETLDDESSMGTHPNWDSLNQVAIVTAIEADYDIIIEDEDILKYSNMKAITQLFDELSAKAESAKG